MPLGKEGERAISGVRSGVSCSDSSRAGDSDADIVTCLKTGTVIFDSTE